MIQRFLLLLLISLAWAEKGNKDDSFHFRTEKDIVGQYIDTKQITKDRSLLAPGFLFFSPSTWVKGWGPQIYDTDGLLIWNGKDAISSISQQFYACDYHGSTAQHLCWHEASSLGAERQNANTTVNDWQVIYDNTYTQVDRNYTTTGKLKNNVDPAHPNVGNDPTAPDSHEFYVVDDGSSYLQTVYSKKKWDLSPWGASADDGWILDSCFQDIELGTEKVFFKWCYSENVEIESHVWPHVDGQKHFSTAFAGNGEWYTAWDFFHINSVDKNDEHDYLISGRHADQIIKLAGPGSPNGKPGEIIWRLGGDSNQFDFEDDFVFTRQHHARYVITHDEWTFLTLFDNAWEGDGGGLFEELDSQFWQAWKLSRSGGSMQMLPNKNMFIGWGFIRDVTEFAYDGTVLFHAHLENANHEGFNTNYRNYKFPWVGTPAADPKLIAYSQTCEPNTAAPLLAYVSWNGATEVARWRFRTSDFPSGPWISRATIDMVDFETKATVSTRFYHYVKAEAVDANGKVIRSVIQPTFVPNRKARMCDAEGCDGRYADYESMYSMADSCKRHYDFPIIGFVLTIVAIELCSWFFTVMVSLQRLKKTEPDSLGLYAMLETKQNGAGGVALPL